jgi:hypothetical protein
MPSRDKADISRNKKNNNYQDQKSNDCDDRNHPSSLGWFQRFEIRFWVTHEHLAANCRFHLNAEMSEW